MAILIVSTLYKAHAAISSQIISANMTGISGFYKKL